MGAGETSEECVCLGGCIGNTMSGDRKKERGSGREGNCQGNGCIAKTLQTVHLASGRCLKSMLIEAWCPYNNDFSIVIFS